MVKIGAELPTLS